MYLTRSLLGARPAACSSRQCILRRTFKSACYVDPGKAVKARFWEAPVNKQLQRAYADFTRPRMSVNQNHERASATEEKEDPQFSEESRDGTSLTDSAVPWYLQVQTPPYPDVNPMLERQRLPELPTEPPPLLQPILEHVSVSLGLDDLRLFDLRDIDPPLALGANLMVLIGTGRSEKHIHVSADRFCRWLRTEHKLRPYADGLLGRGELKLKMRRKARRARIMSHVGVTEAGQVDDGIRTGWVCVNIGTIEDGRPHLSNSSGMEDYVGFGSNMGGVNVVVQMLVQEKREELELEQLLGSKLRRHERKQKQSSIAQEQIGEPSPDHALLRHGFDTQPVATTANP